jgi:hypothetical protein
MAHESPYKINRVKAGEREGCITTGKVVAGKSTRHK